MGQFNVPQDIIDYIDALEKRVRTLETVANLHAASIDAGDLTVQKGGSLVVKGSSGNNLLRVGRDDRSAQILPDGTKQSDFALYREDGSAALVLWDPIPLQDGFHQFLAMYDRQGNLILSDDTTSGEGLARPYIPLAFHDSGYPTATTTSSSFAALQETFMYKQHPRLSIDLLIRCSAADTSGEFQIINQYDNTVLWPATAIPLNGFYYITCTFDVTQYNHMQKLWPTVQARRTAGTGTVGIQVANAIGIQT